MSSLGFSAVCPTTLELLERLALDFPTRADYRHELSASYTNIAILLHHTGRLDDAERAFRKAIALNEQLSEE